MKKMTVKETAAFLRENDRFLILTHRRPDGDTTGTGAFLCRLLRAMGKTAHILKNPELTEKYACLHEGLTKDSPEDGDTLISVDAGSANMLPEAHRYLAEKVSLRIDHHGTADSFTPMELVEPETAACAEIIYKLSLELRIPLDKEMATALYTAVSTDTGCFRYANTTAHTFRTAAACCDAGGDLQAINQAIFDTNSFGRLRLQSWITEHVQFLAGGNLAICAVPREVEEQIGVDEDDLNDISSFLRSIEGVKMSALLRQTDTDRIKASVRAVPGYSAAIVCESFGGGGHAGAAGCSMKMSMDEAVAAISKVMLEWEMAE
jgi:phosphoesterase RecJ-like protein